MIIFTKKHFSLSNRHIFLLFIKLAIYFRASLSIIKRAVNNLVFPVVDALLIFSGFFLLIPFWAKIKFHDVDYYPPEFLQFIIPSYIIIWIISIYINNGYNKPARPVNVISGIITGTIFILIIYALLPPTLRFSRALILMGGILALSLTLALRLIINKLGIPVLKLYSYKKKTLIIAGYKEYQRLKKIIQELSGNRIITGFVNPSDEFEKNDSLGSYNQIADITKINKVDEIIFSVKSMSGEEIIKNMMKLSRFNIDFKIAHPEGLSIIGSHSVDSKGEILDVNLNAVSKKNNLLKKRILDIVVSLMFLVTLPVSVFTVRKKHGFIINIFKVISGKISWVGYSFKSNSNRTKRESVIEGVLTPANLFPGLNDHEINKINLSWAKDYSMANDLEIIVKKWKLLGN